MHYNVTMWPTGCHIKLVIICLIFELVIFLINPKAINALQDKPELRYHKCIQPFKKIAHSEYWRHQPFHINDVPHLWTKCSGIEILQLWSKSTV